MPSGMTIGYFYCRVKHEMLLNEYTELADQRVNCVENVLQVAYGRTRFLNWFEIGLVYLSNLLQLINKHGECFSLFVIERLKDGICYKLKAVPCILEEIGSCL